MHPLPLEPLLLDLPRLADPLPDGGGGLRRLGVGYFLPLEGRNLDMQVDAVQKGAGDPAQVFLYLVWRAGAFPGSVGVVTAGAFLRCHSLTFNLKPKNLKTPLTRRP